MERRWKVLLVVSVAVFMVSLDLFIVNIAFPEVARTSPAPTSRSSRGSSTPTRSSSRRCSSRRGGCADRVGRRRGFLPASALFLAGSTLSGWRRRSRRSSPRGSLQATGAAFLVPTSLALLLPEFPPAERSAAIGIWAAVGGVAAATGPPWAGCSSRCRWRLVFLVNVPVGLVAAFYAVRLLRETKDESALWPDWIGTAMLTVGIGSLALGAGQGAGLGLGRARRRCSPSSCRW